ncbi:DHHW family protein [Ruminococcus sp.]|uniref:DHHW family protein n=1 Tax=Ruminococcus sp. TaxID=41978 RepID=UPI003F026CC5
MRFKDDRSRFGRYIPAFVFLIFIFGMAVWFLFNPKSDYSSSEKRYLQQFPDVSVDKVLDGTFGTDFESYFADQFPARSFWVGLNAYYSLDTGNNGANGVYNCGNGYLINKPVSTDNKLEKNVNTIVKFKNTIDVPITVMFAPSTGYVADDVLPAVHDKYNDDTYFEQISSTLSANGISFVDLRKTFKDAYANGNQLYYKTDHHWTTLGAYTAYEKLCEQLNITPAPKEKFDIKTYGGFYGTTYSTSGFWFTQPDSIQIWDNPENTDKNIKVKISEGTNTDEFGSMYFYDHLEEDDKYPVFIDGNHALTEITNSNAEGGTILLVKDSFSHSLAPFLAENYSKIILVDMRYYKMSVSQIVEQEKPEQVVFLYGIDNIATDTDLVWIK